MTKVKKRDLILIAVLLAAVLILFFVLRKKGPEGDRVIIRLDGEVFGEYSLSEEQTIHVETEWGINILTIKGKEISVIEADCPGGDCIRQGKISRENESIVCLPHKMVVEVRTASEQPPDFDAVAK